MTVIYTNDRSIIARRASRPVIHSSELVRVPKVSAIILFPP